MARMEAQLRQLQDDLKAQSKRTNEQIKSVNTNMTFMNGKRNHSESVMNARLAEQIGEMKKMKTELIDLRERQEATDYLDLARLAERGEESANLSNRHILLIDGLDYQTNVDVNKQLVRDFFKNHLDEEELGDIEKVFVKQRALKVYFGKNETAEKILKLSLPQVRDVVSVQTTIRRRILNVFAKRLNSEDNDLCFEVPKTGSQPTLILQNKKEEYTRQLLYVDALISYSPSIVKADLADVYKIIELNNLDSKSFLI
jgi:hypothetical protein